MVPPDWPDQLEMTPEHQIPPRESVSRTGVLQVLLALFLFLLALGMFVMAFDFSSQARRIPILVGLPFCVMTAANLVVETRRVRNQAIVDSESGMVIEQSVEGEGGLSLPVTLAIVVGTVVLFVVFGQIVSAVVSVALVMLFVGKESLLRTAIAVVIVLVPLLTLTELLGVQDYPGLIGT